MGPRETMRVLFATPILHHPPKGGPSLRIENTIKALAECCELHVYARLPHSDLGGDDAVEFYGQYCQTFQLFARERQAGRAELWLRRVLNGLSRRTLGRNVCEQFGPKPGEDFGGLLHAARRIRADVIWLGYGNISYPSLRYIKQRSAFRVVVDTDSVWSRFVLRGLPFASNDSDRSRIASTGAEKEEEERWGTGIADVTTAVSEVDAQYYRELASQEERVRIFSNVIDMATYATIPDSPTGFHSCCMYLAGSFGPGSPMDHAARWVIEKVLPRVRESMPSVHLYIVGSGSDAVLRDIREPGITVTGELHSVLPYLCHAAVALVPLWFESGTRFKILEAGACGIPVVSTSLGAEGISVTNGKDIVIADTPEEFAAGVLRVLSDREFAAILGRNLRDLVGAGYSLDTLAREGQEILDYLASVPPV